MPNILPYTFTASNNKELTVTNTYQCDGVEYKTTPYIYGYSEGHTSRNHYVEEITSVTLGASTRGRYAIIIPGTNDNTVLYILFNVTSGSSSSSITINTRRRPYDESTWTDMGSSGQFPRTLFSGSCHDVSTTFSTNIPVFKYTDLSYAQSYISTTNEDEALNIIKQYAINYKEPEVSPIGYDFEITDMYTHGTWITDQQPPVSDLYFKNFRAKYVSGEFALYVIEGIDSGKLKFGIKNNAVFYNMQYSTDGSTWNTTNSFPYDYFIRKRENELGEFDYALVFSNTYIPIFANEAAAQGYINGTVDITAAINWGDISLNYPIVNGTGDDESQSDFGEVKTKGFFSQQYIMDETTLTALANDLFDTSVGGVWEAIKKGLDMYPNYIEAIMGLSFWPVDLTTVYTVSPASYIWLGGYGWEPPSGGSPKRLTYPNGYKSIGTVTIKRTFNSWRDMEPYSKLYVMLPYCGTYQLDLARYYDKSVEVRYYFDTRTNGCIACLIADGFLTDYFNGQMGVTMPITLTDYSAYMNAQIQTLLGGGGQAVQQFGNAAGTIGGIAPMGAAAAAAGGAAMGAFTGVAGAQSS